VNRKIIPPPILPLLRNRDAMRGDFGRPPVYSAIGG
jgi:hypothetical protein